MMKSMLFLIFFLVLLIGNPESSVASGSSSTHPHTTALELKPSSLLGSYQTASICFLGVGDCDPNVGFGKGDDYTVDTEIQCTKENYTKQNCSAVQIIDDICPYNPTFGKGCKCRPGLVSCTDGQEGVGEGCNGQYASCQCKPSLVACAANQNGTGAYCGGKYESCSCKPEYQYNSSNCTSPRSLGGATCGGKYTNCTCPGGVSSGAYGCKSYYGSPCGSVCQVAYSDNCHIRDAVQVPYGCVSNFVDCASKCEVAYPDNCRNRTAVATPDGCQQAWSDCSSKCQIAVTYALGVGDILYSDKSTSNLVISGKTPIGIVFDVGNRLATALTEDQKMFSYGAIVKNNIAICNNVAECTIDGKGSTKALVDFDKATKNQYPAANYCYDYITSGTSSGDWFLPSMSQLSTLNNNANAINSTLAKIGGTAFKSGKYWSSNQHGIWEFTAWGLRDGKDSTYYGTSEIQVRPVINF